MAWPSGCLKIKHNAALAKVESQEVEAARFSGGTIWLRRDVARGAATRRLDKRHLRAQINEVPPNRLNERPGNLHDAQSTKRRGI